LQNDVSRIVTWLTLLTDQMSDEHRTERRFPKLLILPRYLGGAFFIPTGNPRTSSGECAPDHTLQTYPGRRV